MGSAYANVFYNKRMQVWFAKFSNGGKYSLAGHGPALNTPTRPTELQAAQDAAK
jgi:hypothetical protein